MKKILLIVFAIMLYSCTAEEPKEIEKPNILVIGNSIVKHTPLPHLGWFNDCGMAASKSDKDFYSLLEKNVPHTSIERKGAYWWESQFNYTMLEPREKDYDLIIIKVGENIGDLESFEREFVNFVNFYHSGKSKVVVLSTVLGEKMLEKDGILKTKCEENGYIYVDLKDMQLNPQNFAWNEYENGGIGCHPSDLGMQYMTNKIIEKL